MDFFREFGNKISARNFIELYRTCRLIKPQVSQKDYNSKERERYYITNMLLLYAVHDLISYPVTIESLDTGKQNNIPDFRIIDNKCDYILETVMATTEIFIKQSKIMAIDGKTYKDYTVTTDKGKAIVELREEKGSGFKMGFENEKAFAIVVSNSIIDKTKKLPTYKVENGIGKELLVYHNLPGSVSFDYAVNWLYEELNRKGFYQLNPKFEKVHILKDNYMLYDIFGVNKMLHIYTLYEYLDRLNSEN